MKLLITGGCGFLGSNLAYNALKKNIKLVVFDNLSRSGSINNLEWLIRNTNDVNLLIQKYQPEFIFHLAGQVAMTTSIENPRKDFEINIMGSLNLLEAVRLYSPQTSVLYSSTNKVYGDLEHFNYTETLTRYVCNEKPNGFDENINLDFHSPYGVSKGSADQYMLDYHRIFGINTVVFRHSSMYGGRQFATYDQGWIGWFCQKAHETKENPDTTFNISGNGKQVRDVLHANDIISLYYSAVENIHQAKGHAFNIGGGVNNSLSLLELFNHLEECLQIKLNVNKLPVRSSDQKVFIADIAKAKNILKWTPKVSYSEGVNDMLKWTALNC